MWDEAAQRLALPAAGENKARKRKTAKATKKLQKRADSQPSGAHCVGRTHGMGLSVLEKNTINLTKSLHEVWTLANMKGQN